MKAPKCRLCGQAHWGLCSGNEAVTDKPTQPQRVTNTSSNVTNTVTNGVTNKDTERQRRWRAANLDEYRAYMREYMRRKRAQK